MNRDRNYITNFPLVSFVTPSFNTLKYIKDTISSIHNQSYPNLQHIIMDGGSNDGTVEYVNSLKEIIFISEKDKGQSNAINKAFDLCEGEIIGWLNSDDISNPGAIDYVVKYFDTHPEIEYIHSDVNIIDEEGQVTGRSIGEKLTLEKILFKNPVKQPALFMRKSLLKKLGRLREDLHFVMDMEFWLRIVVNNIKGAYISDQVFANFRIMPGTKTVEAGPSFLNEWKQVLTEYHINKSFSHKDLSLVTRAISHTTGAWYLGVMRDKREVKGIVSIVKHFRKALFYNPTLWKNKGAWTFFLGRLLGLKINRDGRFKKNEK